MSSEPTIKTRNAGSTLGQALAVPSYVLHGIRRHKRRSVSLMLGVLIGVALVSSVFVWTDTGSRVAIDDFFADNAFHYFCHQRASLYHNDPYAIYPVKDWVDAQETTQSSHVVYESRALFGVQGWQPTDQVYPWPYVRGIKDCAVFFADNSFLADASQSFTYSGAFELTGAQCLVSERVVNQARTISNINLAVGSIVNLAIALSFPGTTIRELSLIYVDVQVVGIYDVEPRLDPLHQAFPSESRENWGPGSGQEEVFGWGDSIVLPKSLMSLTDLEAIALRVSFPRLVVKVDPKAFYALGLDQTPNVLESVFLRIEEQFNVYLGGRLGLLDLQEYIAAYHQRLFMGVLMAPMIILSVLLTMFATTVFLTGRRFDIGILRSRGASYRQLYAALFLEFLILSSIGLALGGFTGLIVGCLIPSATGFLQFDLTLFPRFLGLAEIRPEAWLGAGLVCLLPPAIFAFVEVRSFLRTQLYEAVRGTLPRLLTSRRLQAFYVITACVLVLPFAVVSQSFQSNPDVAFSIFVAEVVLWVFLCDAGARLLRPAVAGLSRLLRPLFGEKSKLFAKSVRVRRDRLVPLLVLLALTFSVTIFSAVEAQTYKTHLDRQIEYFVGSDIRIFSGPVPVQRANELTAIPGIAAATGFIEVKAGIGDVEFRLIGIDPVAYGECGKWEFLNMVEPNFQSSLAALAANPDGIILPQHLATRFDTRAGDAVSIDVWDQKQVFLETKTFTVVGEMHSAPGLGYANPSDAAASGCPIPGFGFQKGQSFAFCHKDYFLVEVPSWKVYDFVNTTQLFLVGLIPGADFQQALRAIQSLDFVRRLWTIQDFNLKEQYPGGYLFRQGVISLLSIGFVAALITGAIALTLFVNTVVADRRIEYAVMRALGGTRRQVTAMVLGEFAGLILASFLLSLVLGAAFSWLLMYVLLSLFPQPYIVPFSIVWPHTVLVLLLGLVVIAMLAGAYIPARRAGAVQVHDLLRNL